MKHPLKCSLTTEPLEILNFQDFLLWMSSKSAVKTVVKEMQLHDGQITAFTSNIQLEVKSKNNCLVFKFVKFASGCFTSLSSEHIHSKIYIYTT